MKNIIFLLIVFKSLFCFSQQIKVAIVDFDNTSGIAKYDGLGKAMSSMLISDIEANVSPKRLQLVERSQINKILKEQNFQKTSSVDKASSVKMGKLLGVKYLLVGDIFVLNDALVINSRLVDTETGNIKFTEKKEGKLAQWLFLKTALAKGLATSISMPFTEPVVLDKEINSAVVTTFSNAITEKDKGNIDKSEELLKIVEEFSADFKYIDDIKAQLEELKKQVKKNTEDIEVLKKSDVLINENIEITTTDPISAGKNFDKLGNFKEAEKYFLIGLNRLTNQQLGEYLNYNNLLYELCFKYKDYDNAIKYSNNILEIYPLFENAVSFKAQSLIKLQKNTEFILWAKNYLEMANLKDDSRKFSECLDIYKIKNKIEGKFNDISYRTYTKGFSINLLDNEFYQGKNEFFGAMLSQFCEENNKLNGLISTLDFLKKINSEQILNKFDLEQPNQYYIPKSQYVTKIAKSNDNFVIVKTGEPLLGNYFEKSDGTLWSGEGPDKCPCLKVLSKEDFLALKNQQIKKDWQKVSFQTEGWYSLLIKNTKNARERFIDCIYYDTKKIRNNNFKISSENIQLLGTLLENEKNQDINSFLINLYATELYKYSEDLINDVINFGHSFLLEKNYEQAIKIYKLTDSNYMLNNYNLSVIQIIKNDLNDFLAKELISNKDLENVIQKINR